MSTGTTNRSPVGSSAGWQIPKPLVSQATADAAAYRRADAVGRLALLTADALESAVDAAVTGDRARARHILRCVAVRTAARRAAETRLRQRLAHRTAAAGSLRRAASMVQLITDLRQIGQLVNSLARHTANDDVPYPVPLSLRHDAVTVGDFGARRLRIIAEGLHGPAMDPGYVRAGDELRVAVGHLVHAATRTLPSTPDGAPVLAVCAELATCVLHASTHAARAA